MAKPRICKKLPKLCAWIGVFGSTANDPKFRNKWRWLRWWTEILIDKNQPPTYHELAALAYAFLSTGDQDHVEIAREIAAVLLDKSGAYEGSLDPLTRANVQLIAARASASLHDMPQALQLLQAMPQKDNLIKALESSAVAS